MFVGVFTSDFLCYDLSAMFVYAQWVPACQIDAMLIVGRIKESSESLFYYDTASGRNFEYYENTTSYNPLFDFVPTLQQQAEANELCRQVDNSTVNAACVYDYYATGNNFSAGISGSVNVDYTRVQESLGLFSVANLFALLAWNCRPFIIFNAESL